MAKRFLVLVTMSILSLNPAQALAQDGNQPDIVTFSRIDKAWQYSDGAGTRVAVLDWLFDMSPEAAKKYVDPISLIPGEDIGEMDAWHGEWMADIVHRIAPEAKVIPIRIRPSCQEQDRSLCDSQAYEKYLIETARTEDGFAILDAEAAVREALDRK